jgi:hypothetical protein
LWVGISNHSSTEKPFAHQSLFDWYAANFISKAALKCHDLLPNSKIALTDFPLTVEGKYSHTMSVILQSLYDTSLAIPAYINIDNAEALEDLYERLAEILLGWIAECLLKMSSSEAFGTAEPEQEQVLRIIRSLVFVYRTSPHSPLLDGHRLFHKLFSILGAICIKNYVGMVLKPTIKTIEAELGRKSRYFQPLLSKIGSAISAWELYFPASAARGCQVNEVLSC